MLNYVLQNLAHHASVDKQPKQELESDPVPQPSDPGLSKAPPPPYQAASNFPPQHDLKVDLPPPYPDGPGTIATTSLVPAAVYTPLTVPDYPQTAATASDAAYQPSWTSPA